MAEKTWNLATFLSSSPAARSFTGAYDVDVFLSYGHIDNQEGWITRFHSRLQTRLQELLGTEEVVVWRDPKLGEVDAFEDILRAKVSRSALFISVLSPRYLASPSCRKELDWFVAATHQTGGLRVETESRLIRVVKTRLLEGAVPAIFEATLGYEFYEAEAYNTDFFREFDSEPGMPLFNKFRARCDLLAQAAARMLLKMKQLSSSPAVSSEVKSRTYLPTTKPTAKVSDASVIARGADIFLSYEKSDLARAKKLADAFRQEGWSVWWDRKIPPGKIWAEVIENSLRTSRCVVVLWSKTSVKSNWVKKEARFGGNKSCLIPILVDAVEPPFEFADMQAADLTGWDGDRTEAFTGLVAEIYSHLQSVSSSVVEREAVVPEEEKAAVLQPGQNVDARRSASAGARIPRITPRKRRDAAEEK